MCEEEQKWPECEKFAKVGGSIRDIQGFLKWLQDKKDIELARWVDDRLYMNNVSENKLIHEYFDIDEAKLEAERSALRN